MVKILSENDATLSFSENKLQPPIYFALNLRKVDSFLDSASNNSSSKDEIIRLLLTSGGSIYENTDLGKNYQNRLKKSAIAKLEHWLFLVADVPRFLNPHKILE